MTCTNCGMQTYNDKYCSNKCQGAVLNREAVAKWLRGDTSGLQVNGVVCESVKKYLRNKYNDRCSLCGWCKQNPHTGKVPLVADHIDGNWQNNTEDNLRLICPNCDSLQATYGGRNKGKGRTIAGNRRK